MNPIDLERIHSAPLVGVPRPQPAGKAAPAGPSFGQVLSDRLAGGADALAAAAARANVKFSGHAQMRLASRQITLSGDDVARLGMAMTRAAAKGSRDSLMLMDKTAYVVSVANRTVITAVAQDALKENIFTNIDSAMIL